MTLALDIGGTHIRIAQVNANKVVNKIIVNTPKKEREILNTILRLISKYNVQKRIGISIAGFVRNGNVIKTPNINIKKINLKKEIEKKFKCKLVIENDAICAGIAEKKYVLKKVKNFIFITLGTGIGGAIFVNGKLYKGKSFAGEIGHLKIGGKEFEKLASGRAFRKYSMKQISSNLAKGLGEIIYILDPEMIVFGGGFYNKKLIDGTRKLIDKNDLVKRKIILKKSRLNDNAGLIGAAIFANKK